MTISLGTVEEFEKLKDQKTAAVIEVLKDLAGSTLTPAYTEAIHKLLEQILVAGPGKIDFPLGTFSEEGDYYEPIKLIGGKDIDDKYFVGSGPSKNIPFKNVNNYAKVYKNIKVTKTTLDNIFTTPDPAESVSTMFPPCKYVTYDSSSLNLLSEEYHYANTVNNMPICSHPELIKDSSATVCAYIACQTDCLKYHNDFKTIKKTTIANEFSSSNYEYELVMTKVVSFFDSVKCYSFKINNLTTGTVANELYYPCDVIDFDNAKAEAIRIYDEYIAAYEGENSGFNVETLDEKEYSQNVSITPKKTPISFLDHTLSFA